MNGKRRSNPLIAGRKMVAGAAGLATDSVRKERRMTDEEIAQLASTVIDLSLLDEYNCSEWSGSWHFDGSRGNKTSSCVVFVKSEGSGGQIRSCDPRFVPDGAASIDIMFSDARSCLKHFMENYQ